MNAAAAGKAYPEAPFTVDPTGGRVPRSVLPGERGPGHVRDRGGVHRDPQIVADPEVAIDFSRVLHGNQEYEFRRPLREGETLAIRSRIESIRSLGANSFLVLATELVEPGGEVVCTARSTLIERAAG